MSRQLAVAAELHGTVLCWTGLSACLQVLQSQTSADRWVETAGEEEPEAPEREVSFASIAAAGNSVPFAGFAPPVNAAPKRPPRQPAGLGPPSASSDASDAEHAHQGGMLRRASLEHGCAHDSEAVTCDMAALICFKVWAPHCSGCMPWLQHSCGFRAPAFPCCSALTGGGYHMCRGLRQGRRRQLELPRERSHRCPGTSIFQGLRSVAGPLPAASVASRHALQS